MVREKKEEGRDGGRWSAEGDGDEMREGEVCAKVGKMGIR
jgi:hypothetical protein